MTEFLKLEDVVASDEIFVEFVPELNKNIHLKELVPDDIEAKSGEDAKDVTAKMLFYSWVNEKGEPMFKSIDQAKRAKFKALGAISKVIMKFNGLTEESIEEAEKN